MHRLRACLNAGSTGNSIFACLRDPIMDIYRFSIADLSDIIVLERLVSQVEVTYIQF